LGFCIESNALKPDQLVVLNSPKIKISHAMSLSLKVKTLMILNFLMVQNFHPVSKTLIQAILIIQNLLNLNLHFLGTWNYALLPD